MGTVNLTGIARKGTGTQEKHVYTHIYRVVAKQMLLRFIDSDSKKAQKEYKILRAN